MSEMNTMSSTSLFAALAARVPDSVVLVGDGEVWTSDALLGEIDALAARLRATQVLGLLADNSPRWAIADLAALRAQTPVLPLPTFFTPAQLSHALDQTGTDLVLSDQPARILSLEIGFEATGSWRGLTLLTRTVERVALPAGTAKISYTSGSTGAPKGVCLTAEGLLDTAHAVIDRLADLPVRRHLSVLPLSLLLENSAGIYGPLLRGAEIHLPALARIGWQGMAGFAPERLQERLAESRPDSLILVPELLKTWSLWLQAGAQRAPEGLQFVAVGGARVEREQLLQARSLGIPAYQGYGLTECGSVVSLNRPGDDSDDAGRPLAHVRVSIDQDESQVGTRAFLGYLGDAEWDRHLPFATCDLGQLTPAGHIHLAGRRKHLLITSFGRNVSPEWVESVLLAQPEIAQALVAGEAQSALSAVLVPLPGQSEASLQRAVGRANETLPDYARIGGWVAATPFTFLNGMATGNGRPVRSTILNHYAAALAACQS